MTYWQVGAGDGKRDYSDVFLKFGVMLIGPGDFGDYFSNIEKYQDPKRLDEHSIRDIRTFAKDVQEDDVVVLKRASGSMWEVVAIGLVRGGYVYLPIFDDVDGWQLQHGRFVEWFVPGDERPIAGLKRGTFQRVHKKSAKEEIDRLKESGNRWKSVPIPELPKRLSDEDLIDELICAGQGAKEAEKIVQTIHRIRRLLGWFRTRGAVMSEEETVTFLIIPLLRSLGWTEQRLKIEWRNIDIALFENPLTKKNQESNKCQAIIEAKSFPAALRDAREQAINYASSHGACGKVITSDGCRYGLSKRTKDGWKDSAYLNILKPASRHPYQVNVGGAQDLILNLAT